MFSSNNDLRPYRRQANLARFALMVASVMAVIVGVQQAGAELIRINMTGTLEVNRPSHVLPSEFVTGTPFTGQFTYDTEVDDLIPGNSERGVFWYPAVAANIGITLDIAGHEIASDPSSPIQIQIANDIASNKPYLAPGDSMVVSRAITQYGIRSSSPIGVGSLSTFHSIPLASPLGGSTSSVMELRFLDPSGTALSSSGLPAEFNSDSFETMEIVIMGGSPFGTPEVSSSFFIRANVETVDFQSLTVAVPEPSSLLLIVIGVFAGGLGCIIRAR